MTVFPDLSALALISLLAGGVSEAEDVTFHLLYVKPAAIVPSLKKKLGDLDLRPSFDVSDWDLVMKGGDQAVREQVAAFIKAVDVPHYDPPMKFVKLRHGDATRIAALLTRAFPMDPADDVPLQAVANPPEREVFIMGSIPQIKLAEAVIRAVDTDPSPLPEE